VSNDWQLVGHIGVDAGLCWIGDPCYILHKDPKAEEDYNRPPLAIGKDWRDFCGIISTERNEMPLRKSFNYDLGHEGLGVCVDSGYGDGTYPVYVIVEDGRVKEVKVIFFDDEPFDEEG